MKAVIMAGGKGTRLQTVSKDIPKPMFPVFNKPVLEYQIDSLKKRNHRYYSDHWASGHRHSILFWRRNPLRRTASIFYRREASGNSRGALLP